MDQHKANTRSEAAQMFWQGYKVPEIATALDVPEATVYSWKKRDDWDKASVAQKVETAAEARMLQIIRKEDPTEADMRVFDMLLRAIERTAKIKNFQGSGKPKELNPKLENRGRKTDQEKNYLSEEDIEKLEESFREMFQKYLYQWDLYQAWFKYDILNFLKSRQIGLTFFWALFGGLHAIKTGDNWIFLSASKNQAHIFKNYIIKWVRSVTGVELKGDPIKLWNGAELYFLGTNKNTAQGYHGHLVCDEYQWIQKFGEFQAASSGMALHDRWKEVYLTTPSNTQHDGWKFWDGSHFNKGRPRSEHITLDVSHKALARGRLCEDGQYRKIITVEDAMAGGADFFNIEKLRLKYSPAVFDNLLMCQPVDSTQGIFTLQQMQACMVDSWEDWPDFEPLSPTPFGSGQVWIGYDPSRKRDDAACVVIAPPLENGGKYRILEKFAWQDMSFPDQAEHIRKLTEKYNVKHIGVDTSGIGQGVYDLIKVFFPTAVAINYSIPVKNDLVLKAMHLIGKKLLAFDSGWTEMALAFMTIKQGVTPSGIVTYQADRDSETGHADLAWAVMHALISINIARLVDAAGASSPSFMEFYE